MDTEPIHQPPPGPHINFVYNNQKGWPKRYKIVAFIVVLLVFANIGAYALRMYYYNQIVNFVETLPTYTPRPSSTKESEFCIQVITPARFKTNTIFFSQYRLKRLVKTSAVGAASLKNKTPLPRQTAKRGRNKDGCEHSRGIVDVTIVAEPVVVPVPRTVIVEIEVKRVPVAV